MTNERVWIGRVVICLGLISAMASLAGAQALPVPWVNTDIGSPNVAGAASVSGGTFTVTGGGTDIWGTSDQFQFMYQPVDGDMEIVARVDSIEQRHQWSKAGVMIRAALTPGSSHAFMTGSAAKGWAFQSRLVTGGSSVSTPGSFANPPGWVKLVRSGDTFRGYESIDGSTWVLVGTETVQMAQTVYVGLAVTSHNSRRAARATFTNVTVVSTQPANQPPTVTLIGPASGTTYTAPATVTFQATVGDTDGTISRVDFYAGAQLILSDTTSPYGATWNNVPAGTYDLTAVATDNGGAATTSSTARVTVNAPTNQSPSVSITSPTNGASYTAPATVTVNANATDADGTVTRVDFYRGSTLIASDTTSPYSVTWSSAPAGTYALTAVAFDNAGASASSAAVNITVSTAPSAPAPVAFVQRAGIDAGSTTSASLTFPSANTAGNFIVVAIRAGSLDQVFTITDTVGNQYRKATQFNVTRDGVSLAVFYAENIIGGTNTVRVADSKSGTLRFSILEYAGVATTGSLNVSAAAEGSGTAPNSGTATTTTDGALLIGIIMTANPATVTAGSGYTIRSAVPGTTNAKLVVEDRVQSTAGPAGATATLGITDVWGAVFAAFRVGTATQQPPGTPTSPSPSNGSSITGTTATLSWTAAGATTYDVRFGTTSSPPLVATNLTSPTHARSGLTSNTTYFWQIVARNTAGTTTGPVWSFTTAATTNQPPTVSITSPANGASYTAPATVTINANATDADGTVTRVDFYRGSTLIGSDTTSPYSVSWNNVAAGTYALTAVAVDNAGASTTSATVNVTVSSTALLPTKVAFTPSADHATAVTSYSVAIRRATDPVTATPVATKNLGKPAPVNNEITVDISDIVNPLSAGSYYAVVTAIGAGGASESTPSGSFTR
ncbi:MAG: Ig-like domain-containing protein [Vicinamibacterales bacterium]